MGRERLASVCKGVDGVCSRCNLCTEQCVFLQTYGNPGVIAEAVRRGQGQADPFECSLCGLCDAVCPENVRPEAMFLEMRRDAVRSGDIDLKRYASLLRFEARGDSNLLSLIRLPDEGDTVLFPGCALPASRSGTVRQLFRALQAMIPGLGIALGCCMKPSHDLGRESFFTERFERLRVKLLEAGVSRVVTTCPNCFKVFGKYCPDLRVTTAYDLLADVGFTPLKQDGGEGVIHDPCPGRFEGGTQEAVRTLAGACGISLSAMKNSRKKTVCCGEGGAVGTVNPAFANSWTKLRHSQAGGKRIITSCVGCTGYLNGNATVDHVLDILFDSRPRLPMPGPLGDLRRLRLKRWFLKTIR